MGSEFKWGIIGPGRIADKFARAIAGMNGASIHAIASRSTEEPEKLKVSFGAAKCYRTYEELVADSAIDAIYISTPHRFHYENIKLCLDAKKPVLCEKPITVNATQAQELFAISQKKKVFLMEALWTRFLPIYTTVKKWITAGEIGDIRHVHSSHGFIAKRDPAGRLLNINLAGGTVLDLGVYTSGMAQWVFGENPRDILALAHIGETGVDETINVSYAYADGESAQFICTFEFVPLNHMVIYGSGGRITIHPRFFESVKATLEKDNKKRSIRKPFKGNGFEYQIAASMDAIREGRLDCPQMPQLDSLANMRALDTIRDQIGLHYPFE